MPYLDVIDRNGESRQLSAREGDTVMEVLRDAGLPIEAVCGGCCVCATCHVYIDPAWVPKTGTMTDMEADMLDLADGRQDNSRLACQIHASAALDGLVVRMPETQH